MSPAQLCRGKMSIWRLQFPSKKEAVLSVARKSRIPLEQPLFSDVMSLLPPEENLGKSREGYVFKHRGSGWRIPEPQCLHWMFQVLVKDVGPVCRQDPEPPPAKGAERLLIKD